MLRMYERLRQPYYEKCFLALAFVDGNLDVTMAFLEHELCKQKETDGKP